MKIEEAITRQVRAEVRALLPQLLAEFSSGDDDEFVDTEQAAKFTGMSRYYFECGRSKGDSNQPPHYKIGRRVLYRRSELVAWMRKRREA